MTAPKFAKLGITNVAELLEYYPKDWAERNSISEFHKDWVFTEVTVIARDWLGGKFSTQRAPKANVYVEDKSGRATLVCYKPGDGEKLVPGGRFLLCGRFKGKYDGIQSSYFYTTPATAENSGIDILPIYKLTKGIGLFALGNFIRQAIEKYAPSLKDEIPAEIISRDNLLSKSAAVKAIHFPASFAELESAKKTLIYEELFYFEIMIAKRALERRALAKGHTLPRSANAQISFSPLQKRFIERLPFQLTQGQCEAIEEINADMGIVRSGFYMSRLLQGDVGSGKTLVSFLAALRTVDDGAQAVLMAPTELLARQHAESSARLLEPLGLRIAFLTGNIKAAGRKELLRHLAAGEIDIAVGTHALFSKDVAYKNLKLVVIDEQHRFGVVQRSFIMDKGDNPHLFMMSATPIPRTLAMTVFGDMDVSVIRDLPPGRKPIKTHTKRQSNGNEVYDFVRRRLQEGSQAYFVYPLIESDDENNLKDATSMAEKLATKMFPSFSVALIHSKVGEEEKRQTMERFRSGEIKILVATSVVEVGVDVPNANCMVIEHAERFGLSALHQLRGRVGRGQEQAYCFLIYSDELTEDGKARINVMRNETDGFVIAEEDLRLRGHGQISGTEQSGHFNLGIADTIRDIEMLVKARADAFFILENDPDLVMEDHRIIARVLEEAPAFSAVML